MSPRTRRAVGIGLFAFILGLLVDLTPVGQYLDEAAYDQRMVVWRSVEQSSPSDLRLRLVTKNESTSLGGWSDEQTLAFLEDVLQAGAQGVILFDVETLFSDWDSISSRLPDGVLALTSEREPWRQLHLFDSSLKGRDVLRSFQGGSPQLEFTETLAQSLEPEAASSLRGDLLIAFLIGNRGGDQLQHRTGVLHQAGYLWRELGALARELSEPSPPDYRGTLVFVEYRSRAADRFEVLTPVGYLSPAEVYISAVNSLLVGDRFVEPPVLLQLLLLAIILFGLSFLSAGLRPWQLFVLGVFTMLGMYAATLTLFEFGLTMPVVPLLLGALTVFLVRALMDFRRATALLKSFGGAEDSRLTGEEALATIFFTELPRYLLDLEKENSPDLLKRRREYNALLERITVKYRGRVLDFQGDAQMVGFGLRIADDLDHPLEATAAALEFVEECRSLAGSWGVEPEALQVHAGVCSGPVALGHVGAQSKQDIAAIGDTTNTAARLMGAAMKLKIPVVIAETTFEMADGRIEGEPLPPVELKGKSAPVAVYRANSIDPEWLASSEHLDHDAVPAGGTIEYRVNSQRVELLFTSLLILASLVLGVYLRGLITSNRLELAAYDMVALTFAQRPADPRIVLVGVDQESVLPEHLGPYPWPRSAYARAIENLRDTGYKGVFFDILLRTDRADDPLGDQALVEAVKGEPRAVLAASLVDSNDSSGEALGTVTRAKFLTGLEVEEMLEGNQAGLIHRLSDRDGVVRAALLAYLADGLLYPTGALALLLSPDESLEVTPKGLRTEERLIPSSTDPLYLHELAIRFGPSRTEPSRGSEMAGYRYVSFHRLLDPGDPIFEELEGAYLLVGDTFSEGERKDIDRVDTPVGRLKGVEVHARTLDTLLNEDYLWTTPRHNGWDTLVGLLVALLGAGVLLRYRQMSAIGPRLLLLLAVYTLSIVSLFLLFKVWIRPVFPLVLLAFVVGAVLVARYLLAINALARFIPAQVVEELMFADQARDRRQIATVLLTDIRGYTTLSEGRSAVGMLDLLNEYHSRTVACYERYKGQVLTYQGDAQIVVFGVFGESSHPATDAVAAALELQKICQQLRTEWGIASKEDFDVGAGLCTGEVEVGFLGGTLNRQYSVVGETVRKSHKVQSMSDELEAPVLLDEETKAACDERVQVDDLGLVQPKGLPHPIRLYRARAVEEAMPEPMPEPELKSEPTPESEPEPEPEPEPKPTLEPESKREPKQKRKRRRRRKRKTKQERVPKRKRKGKP